jgi:hypothetical protein
MPTSVSVAQQYKIDIGHAAKCTGRLGTPISPNIIYITAIVAFAFVSVVFADFTCPDCQPFNSTSGDKYNITLLHLRFVLAGSLSIRIQ